MDGTRSQTSSARDSAAIAVERATPSAEPAARRADLLCIVGLGLLALAVLHARLGLFIVDPTNLGWMQKGDWLNYLHGWSFYRFDDWRFPLGYFSSLLHPVGTSTGLTDSIPWLALIGKALDPLLPRSFQYFGAYLLLCFFLQGLLGFRIMMLLSGDRLHSLLSAAFLMAAPVLLDRVIHIALCSQWLVLAMILWNLQSAKSLRPPAVYGRRASALNLLAAVTHPYLWVMTFVLSLPLFVRPLRQGVSWARILSAAAWIALQIVLAVLGWWAFGYLTMGSVEDGGFGDYAGGFLGFFNSAGKTTFVPAIKVAVQNESFDFVGLGISLVAAIVVASAAWRRMRGDTRALSGPWRPSSPLFPLLLVATSLWLFSLARLAPLFRWLGPLTGAFRCSGRFAWPLYYCFILFLLWRYRRAFPSRFASAALFLLLAVQLTDLKPYWVAPTESPPIPQVGVDPFWREAGQRYRHLVLWPAGSAERCEGTPVAWPRVLALLFYAGRERMTINSGVTSRPPRGALRAACDEMQSAMAERGPEAATLYIVRAEDLSSPTSFHGLPCREIDGMMVCGAASLD